MISQNDIIEAELMPEDIQENAVDWLGIARDAFTVANSYLDANIKKQVERNISSFSSKHAPGSKYHTDAYRSRSKVFRPKTRAAIRRNEAAATLALFSTQDYVDLRPDDPYNQLQQQSVDVSKYLLEHHMENSIPWFLTAIGAYQDAMVQGLVISKQYWDYREEVQEQDNSVDMAGNPVIHVNVLEDKPKIKLIPIENFLFHPAADWADPVRSSPYLIELIPMHVVDIKERMASGDWIQYDDDKIRTAVKSNIDDSTRRVRERSREDSTDQAYLNSDFAIAWVHHNIVKRDGKDYVYYTLGTEVLLTEPVPLKEAYLTGQRPYQIGFSDIETHKTYPAGSVEISEGIQTEINDIANQRIDNVKLVLNKRYFVRRGAQIDTRSLMRSTPGGVTMTNDVEKDIRVNETNDVTGSSYQEQDRLNVDFDEISGAFNPNTVQSSHNMHQTVGGMNLLSTEANSITEFQLRVFVETWVEPVLKQLLSLIKVYETNPSIIERASINAGNEQAVPVEVLEAPLKLKVNVGFGATNPQAKLNRLGNALGMLAQFAPQTLQMLDPAELMTEIFGAAGYKDGERFLSEDGPGDSAMVQQLQQEMAAMQQELADKQMEMQLQQAKLQVERERIGMEYQKSQSELEASMYRYGADQNLAYEKLKTDIAKMQAEYKNKRDIAAVQSKVQLVNNQLKQRNINNGFDTF